MMPEDYNSDDWMNCPRPEFERRLVDAEILQGWLYPRLERDGGTPVSVTEASKALGWEESKVREAVQSHYWAFLTRKDQIEVDGE